MTESTNKEETGEKGPEGAGQSAADSVRQAFAGLPLDQKISTLIQVELDMLGDAVGSVASAVSSVVDDLARAFEAPDKPGAPTPDAGGPTSAS